MASDGADDKDVHDSAMQCNAYISEGLKVVEKSSVQCSAVWDSFVLLSALEFEAVQFSAVVLLSSVQFEAVKFSSVWSSGVKFCWVLEWNRDAASGSFCSLSSQGRLAPPIIIVIIIKAFVIIIILLS